MAQANEEFMERVQLHERSWGDESYPGRPDLNAILTAPVVVFWRPLKRGKLSDRWVVSLHGDMKEIEAWFLKSLVRMHIQPPDRQYVACYHMHRKMKIRGVRILFQEVE